MVLNPQDAVESRKYTRTYQYDKTTHCNAVCALLVFLQLLFITFLLYDY